MEKQIVNAKNFFIPILSSLIIGCAAEPVKPIVVDTVPIRKEELRIKEPKIVELKPLKWIIVTSDNAESVFKDLKEKNYSPVIFGLTDDSYENLAMNLAEIKSLIIKQRIIIKSYKDYYEGK
jgi:hypothetical protein